MAAGYTVVVEKRGRYKMTELLWYFLVGLAVLIAALLGVCVLILDQIARAVNIIYEILRRLR